LDVVPDAEKHHEQDKHFHRYLLRRWFLASDPAGLAVDANYPCLYAYSTPSRRAACLRYLTDFNPLAGPALNGFARSMAGVGHSSRARHTPC
jgi:hypothetical protein